MAPGGRTGMISTSRRDPSALRLPQDDNALVNALLALSGHILINAVSARGRRLAMKLIVVVLIRIREAKASHSALPVSKRGALPFWTWFIQNPRLSTDQNMLA